MIQVLQSGNGCIDRLSFSEPEEFIAEVAGQSYGRAPRSIEGLIRRMILSKPPHTTPFEFVSVRMRVRAPIFVARQWMRHRTGVFMEMSGRRVDLTAIYDFSDRESVPAYFCDACHAIHSKWDGVPLEVANRIKGTHHITTFWWRTDLHNLLHFINIRADRHAQWEIRQYALALQTVLEERYPFTMQARSLSNDRQG